MLSRSLVLRLRFFFSCAMTLTTIPAKARPTVKAPEDPPTQSLMQQILAPISRVLPLSFDQEAFENPKNRDRISRDLKTLMEHSANLETHAQAKDRAFDYVAKSLRSDAKQAYHRYQHGDYEEARFALHNITENCISCHESLPETHKVAPAKALLSALKVDQLNPLDRAHYYVVTRQFDDALKTYEDYFLSGSIPVGSIGSLGSFTEYLKIAVISKGDLQRPKQLLEKLIARPDLPTHVSSQFKSWLQSLSELEAANVLRQDDLNAARKIISQGRERMEFPRDRNGTIHFVAAASILGRFIHSHPDRGTDVAEAYYLLGITESLLSHSFWISKEEFDFETAIRLAPGAAFAPKAYARLEESYTVGFSGSSGTHIPPDVKALLAELRQLIDTAQNRKT